jgi:hypothetical protein
MSAPSSGNESGSGALSNLIGLFKIDIVLSSSTISKEIRFIEIFWKTIENLN